MKTVFERLGRLRAWSGLIGIIVIAIATYPMWDQLAAYAAANPPQLRAPDWAPIFDRSLATQIHLVAALATLAISIGILLGPKGRTLHRVLGWMAASGMAVTAISSLFITDLNGDSWSFIHLLSGWTIIALPLALVAARKHDVARHRAMMTGLFVWGLGTAGLFTFIPGRLMWQIFFA
jgi:uncharacterized membrane protein